MTDNENNESIGASSAPIDESSAQKPGARLAEYREKAGMSVEQVALRLKMTVRQVQQIEADNFDSMTSVAIARGFVRAYARLLNVDPDPLVAMFPSEKPQAHPPTQPKRSVAKPLVDKSRSFGGRRRVPAKLIGIAVIVLLLIVAAVAAWRGGWMPAKFSLSGKTPSVKDSDNKEVSSQQSGENAQKEKAPASGSVATEVVAPKVIITEDAPQPAGAPKPEASPAEPAGAAPSSSAPVEPATPVSPAESPAQRAISKPATSKPETPEAAKTESESGAAAPSKGSLTLHAREKSWIQVLRANSSVLFERTLQPGQTETIQIREPISLTVGNAAKVEATFRGQPLELKTTEYSSVARLKLK